MATVKRFGLADRNAGARVPICAEELAPIDPSILPSNLYARRAQVVVGHVSPASAVAWNPAVAVKPEPAAVMLSIFLADFSNAGLMPTGMLPGLETISTLLATGRYADR